MACGADMFAELGCVAAVAEGAVDDNLAWGWFKAGHNILKQDGDMCACGGFAFCVQVLLDFGVGGEVMLLVFLLVGFRVGACVSGAAFVMRRLADISGLFKFIHIRIFTKKA